MFFSFLSVTMAYSDSFLSMPSIGWTKVEQHPFSMCNSPVEGCNNDAVFLVKAEQGELFSTTMIELQS
jgi:hypothetical protein